MLFIIMNHILVNLVNNFDPGISFETYQETPRIVGDDSARSEPTEVADSNNFKPLLKEKRLKEQTNVVVEKKAYTWNKEGKEYSRKVLRISKETEIKNNTQGEKQRDSVVYREKKGRKNTLAKEYGEELCGTAGTRHKGRKRKGLTNGEEEAIRDCYKRFIDMIKVYHETARCPEMRSQEEKWEKRPTRQAG
ncbi:hypothetical protein Tco_0536341 [Tanacetum coccineum]